MPTIKKTREQMEDAVDAMRREFATVRTGKATPALLDTVRVDAYGSKVPINQVATVSTPITIGTGESQLVNRWPAAFPTGTRPAAIAPATVPRANGVRIDDRANTRSITGSARVPSAWPRSA